MKLQIARSEDIPKLEKCVFAWAKELGYDVKWEKIHDYLEKRDVILFTEDEEGLVTGLMTGDLAQKFWMKEPILHENWLFVLPEQRKSGIGGALIAAFECWAKTYKCGHVIVTPNKYGTSKPEIAAEKLANSGYDSFGYIMRKEL